MTISTTASTTTLSGNGVTQTFDFNFVAAAASDIEVIYTDTIGTQTTLSPSQYTLVINPAAAGQIWGVGGSVTYPIVGSPIANGTFLTISRILPYTQTITISNQGDFAPQVIEEMGDTLQMQIQQVSARSGLLRGTWITNTDYASGDIVIDGANGNATGNYYICAIANTSGVWATDLAAGDWSLAINIAGFSSIAGGSNGQIQYNNAGSLGGFTTSGDVSITASTGVTTIQSNAVTTAKIVNNAVTNAKLAQMPANTVKLNNTSATATPTDLTITTLTMPGIGASGNISAIPLPASGVVGTARNLVVLRASATTATITADEIIVEASLGGAAFKLSTVNLSLNAATTGANGLDTGALGASSFYYLYAIYNPTAATTACLLTSASFATVYGGANMPAGYTMSALIGFFLTDGGSNLVVTKQQDREIFYQTPQTIFTNQAGNPTSTALSLSSSLPSIAKSCSGIFQANLIAAVTNALTVSSDAPGTGVQTSPIMAGSAVLNVTNMSLNFRHLPIFTSSTIFISMGNSSANTNSFKIGSFTI